MLGVRFSGMKERKKLEMVIWTFVILVVFPCIFQNFPKIIQRLMARKAV